MNRASRESLGDLSRTDHCSPVIEDLDQVVLLDPSFFGILGVDPYDPVVITVFLQDPVILDLVEPALLGVAHRVKAESRMWRYQLQGVLFVKLLGMVPLPGGNVFGDDGSLFIFGIKFLQARRFELYQTRGCLKSHAEFCL